MTVISSLNGRHFVFGITQRLDQSKLQNQNFESVIIPSKNPFPQLRILPVLKYQMYTI